MDERVLVISASHFEAVGAFTGFRPMEDAYRAALLDPARFCFRPRSEVETDPSFKQLIPYVVLTCGNQVFHYRRGAGGAEARLTAKRSLGIGGHLAEADAVGGDPYRTGLLREVTEEVDLRGEFTEHVLGFIYDPSTLVGSVHLGVVHQFELAATSAVAREATLADAGFAPLKELIAVRSEFETWSQWVLDVLVDGKAIVTSPTRQ